MSGRKELAFNLENFKIESTVMRLSSSAKTLLVWKQAMVSLFDKGILSKKGLLYLLVRTWAVIGQFSGPYSTVRPSKI